jgi:hypothetical protein
MKPSHFTTPRTMDEATFYTWGASIHRDPPNKMEWQDKLVTVVSIAAMIALAIIVKIWG